MAVSLIQQPTSPNGAYTRLLYVASGSVTTSNPQYQYVMDVYESGSSDRIEDLHKLLILQVLLYLILLEYFKEN